jgi:hypothetical protein
MTIELTPAQARALADLTAREGAVTLHQLSHDEQSAAKDEDVYATPQGAASGYRIAADGRLSEIGETLPAP